MRWIAAGSFSLLALLVGRASLAWQTSPAVVVRLAELEIDPSQLEAYRVALREEITTSIQVEPGVLRLDAVTVREHPNQIRLFEMYASSGAYQAHLQSPHFRKYKAATTGMIRSLHLVETDPLVLAGK